MTEYYIGLEGGLNPDTWYRAPRIETEAMALEVGTHLPEEWMYVGRVHEGKDEWLVNLAGHWTWTEVEAEIKFMAQPPWVESR